MSENLGHIINGKRVVESGKSIEIFNPVNGQVISKISNASSETINKTLNSSIDAFEKWKTY